MENGGHDVPEEKIYNRYYRAMSNLFPAFQLADRVYLFDNSKYILNDSFNLVAEKNGKSIYLTDQNSIPNWLNEYVLKKIEM